MRLGGLGLAVLLAAGAAAAPLFHGQLLIRPAGGAFDAETGNASLKLKGWDFTPKAESDGLAPEAEQITVALGENTFRIEAGAVQPNRGGMRYTYRAPKGLVRGVTSLTLKRTGGSMRVKLALKGLDLSQFVITTEEKCLPMALIIGNDDGFTGVLVRPGPNLFKPKRVRVIDRCEPQTEWPWL